mmetsp:Transcript_129296/g.241810  ORF Transcript_129296/g.241810 Transcript_129296/m.241810 type:complete len:229 (-) Transcript_129296:351-1037(-)
MVVSMVFSGSSTTTAAAAVAAGAGAGHRECSQCHCHCEHMWLCRIKSHSGGRSVHELNLQNAWRCRVRKSRDQFSSTFLCKAASNCKVCRGLGSRAYQRRAQVHVPWLRQFIQRRHRRKRSECGKADRLHFRQRDRDRGRLSCFLQHHRSCQCSCSSCTCLGTSCASRCALPCCGRRDIQTRGVHAAARPRGRVQASAGRLDTRRHNSMGLLASRARHCGGHHGPRAR